MESIHDHDDREHDTPSASPARPSLFDELMISRLKSLVSEARTDSNASLYEPYFPETRSNIPPARMIAAPQARKPPHPSTSSRPPSAVSTISYSAPPYNHRFRSPSFDSSPSREPVRAATSVPLRPTPLPREDNQHSREEAGTESSRSSFRASFSFDKSSHSLDEHVKQDSITRSLVESTLAKAALLTSSSLSPTSRLPRATEDPWIPNVHAVSSVPKSFASRELYASIHDIDSNSADGAKISSPGAQLTELLKSLPPINTLNDADRQSIASSLQVSPLHVRDANADKDHLPSGKTRSASHSLRDQRTSDRSPAAKFKRPVRLGSILEEITQSGWTPEREKELQHAKEHEKQMNAERLKSNTEHLGQGKQEFEKLVARRLAVEQRLPQEQARYEAHYSMMDEKVRHCFEEIQGFHKQCKEVSVLLMNEHKAYSSELQKLKGENEALRHDRTQTKEEFDDLKDHCLKLNEAFDRLEIERESSRLLRQIEQGFAKSHSFDLYLMHWQQQETILKLRMRLETDPDHRVDQGESMDAARRKFKEYCERLHTESQRLVQRCVSYIDHQKAKMLKVVKADQYRKLIEVCNLNAARASYYLGVGLLAGAKDLQSATRAFQHAAYFDAPDPKECFECITAYRVLQEGVWNYATDRGFVIDRPAPTSPVAKPRALPGRVPLKEQRTRLMKPEDEKKNSFLRAISSMEEEKMASMSNSLSSGNKRSRTSSDSESIGSGATVVPGPQTSNPTSFSSKSSVAKGGTCESPLFLNEEGQDLLGETF